MEDIQSLPSDRTEGLNNNIESLYWEKDDVNPNSVIYDLENNKIIVPPSDEI